MVVMLSSAGRRLLSGSVSRLGNLIAAALSSFFLIPFIVHHIGDRLYGFWTLAATFVGYYGLLDFGFSSAVSQYISVAIGRNDRRECRSVFNAALCIQSLFGGVALLVTAALVAAAPWFSQSPEDAALFRRVIAILGLNMAIGFPARVYGGVLEAELRFDIQSRLGIFGLSLRTALTVWAIWGGGGLLSLALVTLFAALPVVALQVFFARREAAWARIDRSSIELERVKSLFSYSIYTFVSDIADVLRYRMDSLVIASLVGLVAVTHYRVARVFTQYFEAAVVSITGIIQPVLSRLYGAKDQRNLEKVFFFATRVSICSSVFFCCGLIFWGKPFIARWIGPNYEDAFLPLVVLSVALLLELGQNPSMSLLYATFKNRFYTYLNCAEGLINLAFSLALARPLGVLGVALGTLIGAFLIRVVALPFLACRVSRLHYGNYMQFLGGTLFRCGGVMGSAIALSAWGLRPSFPWLVSSAICATIIYAAGSWVLVFNQSERKQLLAVVTSRKSGDSYPSLVSGTSVEVRL